MRISDFIFNDIKNENLDFDIKTRYEIIILLSISLLLMIGGFAKLNADYNSFEKLTYNKDFIVYNNIEYNFDFSNDYNYKVVKLHKITNYIYYFIFSFLMLTIYVLIKNLRKNAFYIFKEVNNDKTNIS